ncbi:MAG TPA: FAD-dependent oxidoreductase [Rhizomicrobium sp.]
MDRRRLLQTSLALGGLSGLGACASTGQGPVIRTAGLAVEDIPPKLAPIRAHPDRIFDIRVCIRPFRVKGPNLDVEHIGDTMIVHNYGHGGSGWSLSWGSANIAVQKAMSVSPKEIAVVGCGIVGLSAAITAQRAGAQVTIYAREPLHRTRSVRANGSWTPDSRIALTEQAGPQFGPLWEQMARYSYKTFRYYMGLPERPVDFADQYRLSDTPFERESEEVDPAKGTYATTGMPQQNAEFARYNDRISDLTPRPEVLPEGATPFPVKYVSRQEIMFFNFGSYGHVLMNEFFGAGGKMEVREFHHPSELAGLKEKVVINCPGYAAKDLWKDQYMIPVRGQTGWLIPQPEVKYGLNYGGTAMLSKSDGIMVLHAPGPVQGDMNGIGNANEVESRQETEDAVRIIEKLYARFPRSQA